jgi:anti-sigma28 factor (negative regulator of flagellin synthesis)
MDITKISRFLFPDPAPSKATPESARGGQSKDSPVKSGQQGLEAVTFSSGFGSDGADPARQARVQELKGQIASGTYRQPDSKQLAEAFARELFT